MVITVTLRTIVSVACRTCRVSTRKLIIVGQQQMYHIPHIVVPEKVFLKSYIPSFLSKIVFGMWRRFWIDPWVSSTP